MTLLLRRILPLLCVLSCLKAIPAFADVQVSARNALGIGKRKADVGDEVVFDAALRGDAMFGAARPRAFRIGPAFEIRTTDFFTIEGAAGGGILIPMPGDFPFGLTGLVGYAHRRTAPDGAVGIGTVTWGYRGYNYHSWYGYGLNLFVRGSKNLTGEDVLEITGGIEVDLMFTTVVPFMAMIDFFSGS